MDREPNPGYAFRREIFSNPVPKFIRRSLEHPINKGANQYMTTIGFLDGMVNFGFEWTKTVTGKHWIEADGPYEQFHQNESPPGALVEIQPVVSTEDYGGCRIMVEVKIESVDVDEVLRQVRLYQQYLGTDRSHDGMEQFWVLVVRFDTSPGYRSALEEHGIKIAQLSAKFDEWVAALKNAGASAADEV